MKKSNDLENGNTHIILVGVVVILLVTVLGFVFYQNYNNKKVNSFAECQTEKGSTNLAIYSEQCTSKDGRTFTNPNKQTAPTSTPGTQSTVDKEYLVLDDWGVKIKLPSDGTELVYYKVTRGGNEYYEFTTKAVEALGGNCKEADSYGVGPTRLGALSRYTAKDTSVGSAPDPVNNEELMNGYYYYVSGSQSTCSQSDKDSELQGRDRKTIIDALLTTRLK